MAIASPVGEIVAYADSMGSVAGTQEPITGWLLANGASVAKATYPDLWDMFSLNGTVISPWDLGAPDVNNFRLPNLIGRMPLGVSGGHILGSTGGAETVALSTTEIPSHQHAGATTSSVGDHSHGAVATSTASVNHSHALNYLYFAPFEYASSGGTKRDIFYKNSGSGGSDVAFGDDTYMTGESNTHNHTWASVAVADHTHTVTVNNAGSGAAHNNLPPFITLTFLIKY